jgi:hypothetical protein
VSQFGTAYRERGFLGIDPYLLVNELEVEIMVWVMKAQHIGQEIYTKMSNACEFLNTQASILRNVLVRCGTLESRSLRMSHDLWEYSSV